ncbi:MAG: hypothetical protein JOZ36_15250 [Acidobacteria bacterium]|nr:hypothetical protein [Acidobacteriota bacterium]MBV8738680.1 hypothetical protein [Alphaproteobacteria bacterium]
MPTTDTALRAYRRRLAEAGEQEVLFRLSNETIALIDDIKTRRGLRNRGQVLEHENSARELLKLFEQRRQAAQQ